MKVLKTEIDWMDEFDNLPQLRITVDKLPEFKNARYRKVDFGGGSAAYWAEEEGVVRFFFHDPRNQEGYGGASFEGLLQDGTPFKVKGPWSSNSLSMNQHFPASHEAVAVETEGRYGNLGYAINLTADLFCEYVINSGADVCLINSYGSNKGQLSAEQMQLVLGTTETDQPIGEYTFAIVRPGMTLAQSQAYKRALRMRRSAEKYPEYAESTLQEVRRLINEHSLEAWLS